jgi:hypothetical protein
MFRRLATVSILGAAPLLGGCVDIMQQSYISQIAPEWFEAKAVEVKGEGYPSLQDVPQATPVDGTREQWDVRATALKNQAAELEAKLAADGAIKSNEEVRATAAQWRATVEDGAAAAGDGKPESR